MELTKFDSGDEKYFKDVVFLVEATHTEKHFIWEQYYYNPSPKFGRVINSWEDEMMGHCLILGTIDNRPIAVTFYYAKILGKRVMFYEGTSQLVDHEMIKSWLKHFTLDKVRWDGNTRWAHCDAMNFHLCVQALKES